MTNPTIKCYFEKRKECMIRVKWVLDLESRGAVYCTFAVCDKHFKEHWDENFVPRHGGIATVAKHHCPHKWIKENKASALIKY